MARAAGDRSSTVSALRLLGRAHLFLSEIDQARDVFEECLELTAAEPLGLDRAGPVRAGRRGGGPGPTAR